MTEDKPIAKPIIDDATREKMALMFSGEVYLPDDVDGFFVFCFNVCSTGSAVFFRSVG